MNCVAIELRDVTVVYNEGTPNEVVALRDVSMSVSQGESVAITGGNGSGKSTLLKAIAGTVPIKSGSVIVHGQDVTRWRPHRRAKEIRFVHQDPMLGTCPNLTLHENLQLAANVRWWLPIPFSFRMPCEDWRTLQQAGVHLKHRASTPVRMLSGGQRQLVALAMALQDKRPVMLLDEFTASLDEVVRDRAWGIFREHTLTHRVAVVLVTHDLASVAPKSDRVGRMHEGSLEFDRSSL